MNYEFPIINTIDDVLPAIVGADEFNVTEKEGYTVINYNLQTSDTFPDVTGIYATPVAKIRRELRGIIFDEEGKIIRRPFQKFFNIGERVELQIDNLDLTSVPHLILTKHDGSLISPFKVRDEIIFGTKAGKTDVSLPVQHFVTERDNYMGIAHNLIHDGWTAMFEWESNKQRIVLNHPEDNLTMLGARHMITGEYMDYERLLILCDFYDIPLVEFHDFGSDVRKLVDHTKDMIDAEGFVVYINNSPVAKVKSDWYVAIHKAKEAILWDRNIVQLIIDEKIDDVKAHLPEDDRVRIEKFESDIVRLIRHHSSSIYEFLYYYRAMLDIDKKTFAIDHSNNHDSYTRAILFRHFDNETTDLQSITESVIETVRKNINKNTNWDALCNAWFDGCKFNQ